MKELRAIFIGTVHGVGFRATAKRHADVLGLSGYARNLQDGSVEVRAQGKEEELEKFLSKLKELFKNHIESVDVRFTEQKNTTLAFLFFITTK